MKKNILLLSLITCFSTALLAVQPPIPDKKAAEVRSEEINELIGSETKVEFNSSALSLTAPVSAQDQPELKSFFERVNNAHFTQYHIDRLIQALSFSAPFFMMLSHENWPLWGKMAVGLSPFIKMEIKLIQSMFADNKKRIKLLDDENAKYLFSYLAGILVGMILKIYALGIRPVIPMPGAAARQPGIIAALAQELLGNIIGQANAA